MTDRPKPDKVPALRAVFLCVGKHFLLLNIYIAPF